MNNATTNTSDLEEYSKSAGIIATVLRTGPMPVEYEFVENQYTLTDISTQLIMYVLIGIACVFAILLVYMVVKYKTRGLLAAFSFVGLLAIYLLLLRYTNVVISLESIVAIILVMIINYLFNMKLLKVNAENKGEYNKKYIDFIMKVIPIFAISIIFSFIKLSVLNTLGMTIVWGIVLILAYNRLITRNIVD